MVRGASDNGFPNTFRELATEQAKCLSRLVRAHPLQCWSISADGRYTDIAPYSRRRKIARSPQTEVVPREAIPSSEKSEDGFFNMLRREEEDV
ncbi:MAG TPA: hypothetical protein DCK81_05845 [Clostridiales bacterium UBA9856]|nr:hypothetical protein [Clostridiales bacterium UBA9856]